jgi:hypothetical protein
LNQQVTYKNAFQPQLPRNVINDIISTEQQDSSIMRERTALLLILVRMRICHQHYDDD